MLSPAYAVPASTLDDPLPSRQGFPARRALPGDARPSIVGGMDKRSSAGGAADAESALPDGIKNYMTPQGFRQLRDELHRLTRVERPKVVEIVAWAAANGDRSENGDYIYGKRRLREIDRRIRFLAKRLESSAVVDPAGQTHRDQVFFGATVTYSTAPDEAHTITIVGVDEADLARGQVSWISPIARALRRAREGDIVELRTPAGPQRLEVLEISYPEIPDPV
jgi:transcription elongation factor GreB